MNPMDTAPRNGARFMAKWPADENWPEEWVEGFYSIFKRGMKGVYQHCGKQHLHRYAAEFDFRYNHRIANGVDDAERGAIALRSAQGKRLTYNQPSQEVTG